jgi:hypothetical protein
VVFSSLALSTRVSEKSWIGTARRLLIASSGSEAAPAENHLQSFTLLDAIITAEFLSAGISPRRSGDSIVQLSRFG